MEAGGVQPVETRRAVMGRVQAPDPGLLVRDPVERVVAELGESDGERELRQRGPGERPERSRRAAFESQAPAAIAAPSTRRGEERVRDRTREEQVQHVGAQVALRASPLAPVREPALEQRDQRIEEQQRGEQDQRVVGRGRRPDGRPARSQRGARIANAPSAATKSGKIANEATRRSIASSWGEVAQAAGIQTRGSRRKVEQPPTAGKYTATATIKRRARADEERAESEQGGMRSVHRLGIAIFAWAALCALPGAAVAGGTIKVLRSVGFAEGTIVRPAIKSECKMEGHLPRAVQAYAQKNGIEVELVDALPDTGRVLELEITDAIEMGNAWTGRQKGLVIQGRLLEDGALVGNFRGRRMTTGGFFGGYKGTCAFFGRCAKTLGHDVADWLKSPGKDSSIGG